MNRYDDGKLAGQRAIALFADVGAEAELKHVLAMGVPSIEEVESTLQRFTNFERREYCYEEGCARGNSNLPTKAM